MPAKPFCLMAICLVEITMKFDKVGLFFVFEVWIWWVYPTQKVAADVVMNS